MNQRRRNMAERTQETWSPPLISSSASPWCRLGMAVRRFFDLQLGSIWNDLKSELADAEGSVLDVGCGAQPFRRLLPSNVKYVGIDTSNAKDHFGYEVPDVVHFSGNRWPVQDATVDVMLVTETLEHVFEVQQFLSEVHRCLRPGGKLVATVPFSARWHFIPHDYWRYTSSCLRRLLEEAGLQNIRVYARGNALTVACYKTMAVVLPLLAPQTGNVVNRAAKRGFGLLLSPLFVLCAILGNLSLRGQGGDDCLGYTVLAEKPYVDAGRIKRAA